MNNEAAAPITGAEIVVRCLAEEGVKHVFGYPGGAVLYIYDAIFKQDKFQHVLVRHEQAAVHAADAYSRSSNTVGVALVTSGPGVTNAVTGLSTAYMDSIPMVVISGQVPSHAIGQDAFQECDTVGITRPCVKHNFLVKDVKDLAATIKKAFFIASTGRPGPVLVDIPKDISMHKCVYDYPKDIEMRSYKPVDKGHSGQIRKAVQLLAASRTSDDLHRRRRDSGQCGAGAEQAGRQARLPGHQHADGPGRLPRLERELLSACRACTAPMKRTWRCRTATS
jgi:acetolactate synthase-1/2/3 large subunit